MNEAVQYGEHSKSKCIGLTIETRPDYCLQPHISQLLSYGCTRLEIGVQSIYEDIARDTLRGHTVAAVCDCFEISKVFFLPLCLVCFILSCDLLKSLWSILFVLWVVGEGGEGRIAVVFFFVPFGVFALIPHSCAGTHKGTSPFKIGDLYLAPCWKKKEDFGIFFFFFFLPLLKNPKSVLLNSCSGLLT